MLNKSKRIFALLLAAIMVFSLVGCNKKAEEESSGGVEYIIEEDIEYVTEDGDTTTDTDDNTNNNNNVNTSKPSGNSSQNNEPSSNKNPNKNEKPSNTINNNVDPSKYKGKTVKLALTVDPDTDEGGPVIDAFEKKYGITVKFIKIDSKNTANELNGLIAADEAPDVTIANGNYPTALSYLQSLDAAKLNYKEDIWNQKTFEISTYGGSPYICDTKNNIWAEVDLVVYSKRLLKRAGVKTPEQYDAAGNWTWDAFFEIARAVKTVVGPSGIGGGFQSRENAVHAMGGGFIIQEDGKFKSGINQRTQEAMVKYTEAFTEEIVQWKSNDGIIDGSVGITTAHAYALKRTGFYNKSTGYDTSDLGYYYLPRWDKNSDYGNTGMVRGYGIVKRAKEPVAGGIFLREYLDVANYDLEDAFISEEAKDFFFKITSVDYSSWNPYFLYFGDQDAIAGFGDNNVYNEAMSGAPEQVGSIMASLKGTMEKAASNFNNFVSKNIGTR